MYPNMAINEMKITASPIECGKVMEEYKIYVYRGLKNRETSLSTFAFASGEEELREGRNKAWLLLYAFSIYTQVQYMHYRQPTHVSRS